LACGEANQVAPIFSIAFVIGSALSLRFRFLVLIPAFLTASLILVAIGAARHEAMTAMFLSVTAGVVGLQAGYVAGVLARAMEGLWSGSAQRPDATTVPAPRTSADRAFGANVAVLRFDGHQKHM
jgi:hypothetical protein